VRVGEWRALGDAAVPERLVVQWSADLKRLIGGEVARFGAKFEQLSALLAPDAPEALLAAIGRVLASGVDAQFETKAVAPDGTRRWWWHDLSALRDRDGRIKGISGLCQDVTARKIDDERLQFLARHDPLTGLANRVQLAERLEALVTELVRTGGSVAALRIDLDNFKMVNDLYGHAAGDAVLRTVAGRLQRSGRRTDILARVGGDEFVVIMPGASAAQATKLAARLLEAVMEPLVPPGLPEIALSASIGIGLYPRDAPDAPGLLARADRALNWVKREGRNNFALYAASMEQDDQRRQRLEHDLRLALHRSELSLVYQPVVCAHRHVVSGFEALLRWNSAEHGAVPPAHFIPIAESVGLMGQIGTWVLRTACREAAGWPNKLKIAVNVSVVQFQQGRLPDVIKQVLRETGLEPDRLEIEITESLLIRETDRTLEALRRIKALGVRIAMDDFGTGYSSLATLRTFPFDKLKVDRSFVQDLAEPPNGEPAGPLAIINAILGLGRGLRLPVVVEGVETEAQAEILRRCGCEQMQGYLLSRPLPIENFAATIAGIDDLAMRGDLGRRGGGGGHEERGRATIGRGATRRENASN
jgi:diguanylate cyclase (GGDEF)-like protein